MKKCTETLNTIQKDTAIIIMSSVGFMALVTCLLTIMLLVCCLKLHKHFIYRLAMYQVMSSMGVSIVDVLAISQSSYVKGEEYNQSLPVHHDILCLAEGFLLTYTIWVKLLFTSSLIFHLFLMAVCLKNYMKLEVVYVLVSVIFPLLLSWIPFIGDHYGPAGAWCWITERNYYTDCAEDKVGYIEELALLYVPCNGSLVLCIAAAVIATFVLICRGMKNRGGVDKETQLLIQERSQHKKALKEVAPLLAYPIIFFLLISFASAHRIYNVLSSKQDSFSLFIAHSVINGSWGICSSIAVLLHITVARWLNKRRTSQPGLSRTAHTGEDRIYNYTTINTESYYNIPIESDIDRTSED